MNHEVTSYIEKSLADHKEILIKLRETIFSLAPNVHEQFKWSRPVYALEKDFCYLQSTKKHVNLGFFDYAKIKTNHHLIEGTGKSMRHLKMYKVEDIANFEIHKMLEEVLQ